MRMCMSEYCVIPLLRIGDVEQLECLGAIQKHKYNAAIGVRQIGTPEPNVEQQNQDLEAGSDQDESVFCRILSVSPGLSLAGEREDSISHIFSSLYIHW